MKLNKITVVLAILLVSILALGAVSAESIDDTVVVDDTVTLDVDDSINDVSVDSDSKVKNSLGADEVDTYLVDDDTYSTYFDEEGTATEALSADGSYTLEIGTLTNKDIKIDSGSQINILAKENEGVLNNGSITIGDGSGEAGSITINGLKFINTDKNPIVVNDLSTDITIEANDFDLTYTDDYADNAIAILTQGYLNEVKILENTVKMDSAATYTYGFDLSYYIGWYDHASTNPENFIVRGNVLDITSSGVGGMVEAMYLDTMHNLTVDSNIINVKTTGEGSANYAMQVSDSWGFMEDDFAASPYDITIVNNDILMESSDMAYGITVISLWPFDEEYDELVKDISIEGNALTIKSDANAVAIGVKSADAIVSENEIVMAVDETAEVKAYPDPAFGNESVGIYIVNYDSTMGNYANVTVVENAIFSNIETNIKVIKNDSDVEPLTVEDNEEILGYLINDGNFDLFFDDEGCLNIEEGYTLLLANLTAKDIIVDVPVIINGIEGSSLVNTTISLVAGADGTEIAGLVFDYTDAGSTYAVISVNDGVSDVSIIGNEINAYSAAGYNSAMAIAVYGATEASKNILIDSNMITITGDEAYTYGIDIQNYDPYWNKGQGAENVSISNNIIGLYGNGMEEAIYLSSLKDVSVIDNTITSTSTATGKGNDAYGIGVNGVDGLIVEDNLIEVNANQMAFGVALTSGSSNVLVEDNDIEAVGTGAIGVGIASSTNVSVVDNNITIIGGDYTSIETWDSLGTANAAILDKTSSADIGENKISEIGFVSIDDGNFATYFDEDGKIKDDAPISEGDIIFLGELTNKNIVIDIPLIIKGEKDNKLTNTSISIISGADNTSVSGLNMEFTGDASTGSKAIIYLSEVDGVSILENNIVVTDFVNAEGAKWGSSLYVIEVESGNEGTSNILIADNNIEAKGSANYLYGIDAFTTWGANSTNANLTIDGNTISIEGGARMAEAIYASGCENAVISNNNISSVGTLAAYGIGTDSLTAGEISDNTVEVIAGAQAYAITNTYSNGVEIKDNTINAVGVGAVGIGFTGSSDITVEDNNIEIAGGDYTSITSADSLGTANAAILDKDGVGSISNNVVTEDIPIIIDDNTYAIYFDENGNIKDDAPIAEGNTVLIGKLSNKNMVIDMPLRIVPASSSKLTDSTIKIVEGGDGTLINGLDIEFTGDASTGSVGLIYVLGASDVKITNNNIVVPDFVNNDGDTWGSSLYAIEVESGAAGTNNIEITGNNIEINGSANYLYGIDTFTTWGANTTNAKLTIADNNVTINGGALMAEAIYVSGSDDLSVSNNNIAVNTTGTAYGIGTDGLNGAEITNNTIYSESSNMAYGITSTTSGNDVVIEDNLIAVLGAGAVGIGLSSQNNTVVASNDVSIVGGDYSGISVSDNLGAANAAILDKDNKNTNLNVTGNNLTENGKTVNKTHSGDASKELQDIIDAAPAGSVLDLGGDSYINVKDIVIDKDLTVTNGTIIGKEKETIFEIGSNAEKVTLTGLDIKANNANTIVKAIAENGTSPTSIDIAEINIVNNTISKANDDVVAESVTVLEIDSERGILAPNNPIAVSGNTMDSGIDSFDFVVTEFNGDNGTEVPEGGNIPDKIASVIICNNMTTNAINTALDGRNGEYFIFQLVDSNGNALANKPILVGFNGHVYNYTTDEKGSAKTQINLGIKGGYTFAVSFLGDEEYNASFAVAKITVNPEPVKLTTAKKTYKASAKTKTLTATFKTSRGTAIKGKKITFTVNKKTYTATTNAKGVATVKVSLSKKGTYSFTAKFAGDDRYKAVSVKSTVKIA
ncbi:Ig-like domain-containing protein [uncultured Methanobrevibacter sp.]|uniref:Ig-like domain-containing protein n=1 Tax=uncultured Methanobrevibacter sp. TaxID=253161 RepID=UPI002621CC25